MKSQLRSKFGHFRSKLGFDREQIGFGRHVLSLMIVNGTGDSLGLLRIEASPF